MKKIFTLVMLMFCSNVYASGSPFDASNYLFGAADAWSRILPGGGGGEIASRIQPLQTSDAMQFANFISLLAYNDTAFTIYESDAHMSQALDFLAHPLEARRRACPANVSGCTNVRRSLVIDGGVGASFADYSPSNNSDFKTKTTDFTIRAKAFVSDGAVFGVEYTRTDTDNRDSAIDLNATGNSVTMFAQYLSTSGIFANVGINAGTIAWRSDKTIVSVPDDEEYTTNFWGGQVNTGVQIVAGPFTMTPEIGMRYMHISSESHVDAATQFFDHWRYNNLRATAGATVGFDFVGDGFTVRPMLSGGGLYDIISKATDNVTVRIAGDQIYNIPVQTPGRAGFTGGAGIGVYGARFAAGIDWNIDIRTDYVAHTGMAHAKIVF
ncbi:MAG: autotransporter outer membrane beta-barrel domain-containing protein [Alphaproteobacteria bacterium]|nr:autotransporter outer membrane beta-barrel domain-containing protein [Alphaproteobacteria bacterium]